MREPKERQRQPVSQRERRFPRARLFHFNTAMCELPACSMLLLMILTPTPARSRSLALV